MATVTWPQGQLSTWNAPELAPVMTLSRRTAWPSDLRFSTQPESSLPGSSQPSETLLLLAAEQTSSSFLELSGRTQLTANRSTDTAIKIKCSSSHKTPLPVVSQVNVNTPLRATLSHSLWE
ncbi:protein FAM71F2 [Heterocephalus glaber]|uniref:Protein FAM71F2 n=1 Tax=Heterocephalus glaber TaxID=10181 RepID=A0AAX6RBH8_HETGA|nr:protein FAM71F2 [Heterocephalus glaber]